MEKVLIWGPGKTYRILKRYFDELEENGSIQIVAFVSKTDCNEIDGHPVIRSDDIKGQEYDLVLICAETVQAFEIESEAKKIGLAKDKIANSVDDLKSKSTLGIDYNKTVRNQCTVLRKILDATDDEVASYEWMYDRICEYGIYPFKDPGEDRVTYSIFGVLQTIEEFASYCNYLSTIDVNSAIEIGVFKGRSSYLMCAVLARNNPDLEYLCVDLFDNLDSFDEYRNVLPMLKKVIPATSEDFKGEKYDFVFIDADHSYDGSIKDYENIGQYAGKLTVFHDIYGHEYDHQNGGIVRTWEEVVEKTPGQNHRVFSYYPDKWMGIGVVEWMSSDGKE